MQELGFLIAFFTAIVGLYLGTVGTNTFGLAKELRGLNVRQPRNKRWYTVSEFLQKEKNEETMILIFVHRLVLRIGQIFYSVLLIAQIVTILIVFRGEYYKSFIIHDLIGESPRSGSVPDIISAAAFEFLSFIVTAVWISIYRGVISAKKEDIRSLLTQ